MTLFEQFKETKEEGFREEFIKPLLVRMGFIGISNKHGVNEFGKDYVFSELDSFGQLRHMIIQAKHEEKINQGNKVNDLITQIQQSFNVPYTLPSSPNEERYVSSVYVFNTGKITDNAEKQIRHSLPREFSSNTRFFDGHYLETLATSITQVQANEVRNRLEILIRQLRFNLEIWRKVHDGINPNSKPEEQILDLRGGFLTGLELFLSEPILWNQIDYNQVRQLWEQAKVIQTLSTRFFMMTYMPSQDAIRRDMQHLKDICNTAIGTAENLIDSCLLALNTLPPQTV